MTMGLHPFVTGRPSRAKVPRELFAYAAAKPRVWFPRRVEAADHYLETHRDRCVQTWPHHRTCLPRPQEAAGASA